MDFAGKHPTAAVSLNQWYNVTKAANWNKLSDIKKVFNTVDYVGNDRYVFNIKGNNFRIVAMIFLISVRYIFALLEPIANMIKLIVQLFN